MSPAGEAPDGTAPPPPPPARAVDVLLLCTGNAARSVMAGSILACLGEGLGIPLRVATAGTHAVEGQPMSVRTRAALHALPALDGARTDGHRSRQLDQASLDRADLVAAMEADHVRYVRRRHPGASARTATLRRLCRDLPPAPPPLARRLAGLDLAGVVLGPDEDVADPAGGDQATYDACAAELWELCQALAPRL